MFFYCGLNCRIFLILIFVCFVLFFWLFIRFNLFVILFLWMFFIFCFFCMWFLIGMKFGKLESLNFIKKMLSRLMILFVGWMFKFFYLCEGILLFLRESWIELGGICWRMRFGKRLKGEWKKVLICYINGKDLD